MSDHSEFSGRNHNIVSLDLFRERVRHERALEPADAQAPTPREETRIFCDDVLRAYNDAFRDVPMQEALTVALENAAHARDGKNWDGKIQVSALHGQTGVRYPSIEITMPVEGKRMMRYLQRELNLARFTHAHHKPSVSALFHDDLCKLYVRAHGRDSDLADLMAIVEQRCLRRLGVSIAGNASQEIAR